MLSRVVAAGSGGLDLAVVFGQPLGERADGGPQALAELGQFVLDAWGDLGVDGAGDDPVAFQVAQGEGERVQGDTRGPVVQDAEDNSLVRVDVIGTREYQVTPARSC